jgi:hypothetical protein
MGQRKISQIGRNDLRSGLPTFRTAARPLGEALMKCTTRWTSVLGALLALVVLGTPVGGAWADTFRAARVPLEATVLDEVTGETVEIEATLGVVARCGSRPR